MIPKTKHYIYTKLVAGWRLDLRDEEDNRYFFIFRSDSFESDLVDYILEYEDKAVVYYRKKIDGDVYKQIVTDRYWSITSREVDILCN